MSARRFQVSFGIDLDELDDVGADDVVGYVRAIAEAMVAGAEALVGPLYGRIDEQTGRYPDFDYEGRTYPGPPIWSTLDMFSRAGWTGGFLPAEADEAVPA